jgi:uncharacterized protein (TIGR03435 family)
MNRLLVGIAGTAVLTALIVSGAPIRAQTTADTVPEWQKAAGGKLSFEVASIKLAEGKFTPPNFALNAFDSFNGENPHGRLVAQFPLEIYIEFAYKLPKYPRRQREAELAQLPKWVSSDRYAINAVAAGNPTKDQMRLMLQSLLADRFKLAVHFERQETPALALVLDKPGQTGAKLYPHSNGPPCDAPSVLPLRCNLVSAEFKPNNLIFFGSRDVTMAQVAEALSSPPTLQLEFPVTDQTGLEGRFDFSLEWTRDTLQSAANPDSIAGPDDLRPYQEAIQEQLGLKLKSTRVLINTLVIDHVERPSEN